MVQEPGGGGEGDRKLLSSFYYWNNQTIKTARGNMKKFVCIKCGLCCLNIQWAEELKEYHDGDGKCRFYNSETKLCTIYKKRPEICNVKKSYKRFSDVYTEEEYIRLNYEGCKILWEKEKAKKKNSN